MRQCLSHYVFATLLTVVLVMPAQASEKMARVAAAIAGGNCGMTENATVSINFNGTRQDVGAVKALFDERIKEAAATAKELNLDKFELNNMNYSINPQNNQSMDFQFYGNASYNVLPADKAAPLMQALIKKGFQASMNVNSYRNNSGNCPAE